MGKTDTQTAARPPRPARRVRLEAGESGSSTQVQPTAPASEVELEAEREYTESAQASSTQSGPQQLRRAGERGAESPVPFNFFEPRGIIRPRAMEVIDGLPVATLEGPSTAQLDLTPSPVPRVSLVPATGVVDISLVPGPNAGGSRHLPTLAARHALGRPRQRAAAPAVTFPPSGLPQQRVGAAPKPPRRVRSSQREVVLGLGIGVGLSILLAVGGQALLDKRGPSSSSEPPLQTATPGLLPTTAPAERPPLAPAAALERMAPAIGGADSEAARAETAAPASQPRPAAEVSSRRRAAAQTPRASSRAGRSKRAAAEPAAPQAERAPEGAELPAKTPLSPSESAGLGLALPF